MDNQNIQNQFELFKNMAQQKGISGVAYVDFNPADGFLRLKLKVTPPEYQSMLTSNFVNALAQFSQMFGLQVKTHEDDDGKVGAKV
jgi:lactam utilization protein B